MGCGDLIIRHAEDKALIYIAFLEAYGDGKGRTIVNYLLKSNKHVKLFGASFPHACEFWTKMGATLECLKNGMYPFWIEI